jgi:uncharacterized zinc-type alcohol dehydrogenase-like protein
LNQIGIIVGHKSISGSLIGGIKTTEECIDFCVKHNIYPDIQLIKPDQITWAFNQLQNSNKDGVRFVIDFKDCDN